ncbi:MAG: UbiA family prenyltransferase [Proteobacteria bacterium]|nr:UbiA family prenyltransferase [Pseudomonadota bacterium]
MPRLTSPRVRRSCPAVTSPALPDAAPANWVDRWAPARLRPWLRLGRFDRPVGIWLLMLPGWWGVALASAQEGRWPDPRLLVLFLLGAAVMRAAGCAYNDAVDRDLDRRVARTAGRPVASGRISRRAALAYAVGLSLLGLVVLVQMPLAAVMLGVSSLGLVGAYPFMKRITWWPQLWLGLTFNWGVLVGWAAVTGSSPEPTLLRVTWSTEASMEVYSGFLDAQIQPLMLLYAAGGLWTLGYDTIYALQDLEDDALAGVKSSARRLGRRARLGVAGFYAGCVGLALAAGASSELGPLFTAGVAAFAAHLGWHAWRVRVDDPRGALGLFKSNAWAGLILFAALSVGAWRP